MSTRLTKYEQGHRWSPDRTIRVTPRYSDPAMRPDLRNKPLAYRVADLLNPFSAPLVALTLQEAQRGVEGILAARPRLDWSSWQCPMDQVNRLGHSWADVMLCHADSPVGRVEALISRREDKLHPGMWPVRYEIGPHHFGWLTDIRHIPHRMAHIRAHATHRATRMETPR